LQTTSDERYNPAVATKILGAWSKEESNYEVRKLESDKVLHRNKGVNTTGRPYVYTNA
jgi:hypothetical protein